MDKELLKRILSEHPRVIIPSFGAFLHKQDSDAVIFSPFLKSDDGLVVSIVEQEYGVSHNDAQNMVSEFVAHIRSVLTAKSKFYIDGFGMLLVDSNGAISFVAEIPAAPEIVVEQPMPQPTPQPMRVQPQPISHLNQPTPVSPVIPQPMAPRPIAVQQMQQPMQPAPQPIQQPMPQPIQQPMPQPMRAPIPQPIAQPAPVQRVGVTPPVNTGVFSRPQTVNNAQSNERANMPQMQGNPMPGNPMQGQMPGQMPVTPAQPNRRPQRPVVRKKRNSSNDMWLIIAILAALIVVVILIVGLVMTSETPQFDL